MTIPSFLRDPVFWAVLGILSWYSLGGFASAWSHRMATPGQMLEKGLRRGLPWTGHFGFWHVTFIVHPVLAWATSTMWLFWKDRGALIALCMIAGGFVGYHLQSAWSRSAGSSDAWSENGHPNAAGIIHIQHMAVEIGIMFMLLASGIWYREIPWTMFLGILAIVMNHFIIGSHWPLRYWFPTWRPKDMDHELRTPVAVALTALAILLYYGGLYLMSLS